MNLALVFLLAIIVVLVVGAVVRSRRTIQRQLSEDVFYAPKATDKPMYRAVVNGKIWTSNDRNKLKELLNGTR